MFLSIPLGWKKMEKGLLAQNIWLRLIIFITSLFIKDALVFLNEVFQNSIVNCSSPVDRWLKSEKWLLYWVIEFGMIGLKIEHIKSLKKRVDLWKVLITISKAEK